MKQTQGRRAVSDNNCTDELQKDLKGGLSFYKEYMFAEFLKQYAQLLDDRIRNLQRANEANTNNTLFREGKL